jgi:eukaryotic-like serine/threonine-protein kinase
MSAPRPLRSAEYVAPGYRVFELLRRGGEVDVYDVWSEERDCRCVVKTLRPDRRTDRSARRRLLAEGRLLQRFTHPHLVRVYEVHERPVPLVVMETLTGATLGYLIDDEGPRLPLVEIAVLGIQVCSALTYLHRSDLLHLDLKPANIICQGEQAKLIDLGIARAAGRGKRGVGTPQYMAPEQVRGGMLTTATDVWGLGAVLYEAASRTTPFGRSGWSPQADALTSVSRHRRLPTGIATTINACLDPDPRSRPTLTAISRQLRTLAMAR